MAHITKRKNRGGRPKTTGVGEPVLVRFHKDLLVPMNVLVKKSGVNRSTWIREAVRQRVQREAQGQ